MVIQGKFRNLFDLCDIKYTDYIRTTEVRHKNAVVNFWNHLYKNGFIYKSDYEGWYSVNDENFLSINDVSFSILDF
jgi:methionyl-tRNA synthetase